MKTILSLLGILSICLPLYAQTSKRQLNISYDDSLLIEHLLVTFTPQKTITETIVAYAKGFEGTPYIAGTLDRDSIERLCINLQETDCTTFVETVLALARTLQKGQHTLSAFAHELQSLRYRGGHIGDYTSRLHYFSDWIADNEKRGNVVDISKQLGGQRDTLAVGFMSRNANRYPILKNNRDMTNIIAMQEKLLNGTEFFFLPTEMLDSMVLASIEEGDIIAFTTSTEGLDISHTGIAVRIDEMVHLLHASSTQKQVVIDRRTLTKQLKDSKHVSGIRVIRPLDIKPDNFHKKQSDF